MKVGEKIYCAIKSRSISFNKSSLTVCKVKTTMTSRRPQTQPSTSDFKNLAQSSSLTHSSSLDIRELKVKRVVTNPNDVQLSPSFQKKETLFTRTYHLIEFFRPLAMTSSLTITKFITPRKKTTKTENPDVIQFHIQTSFLVETADTRSKCTFLATQTSKSDESSIKGQNF